MVLYQLLQLEHAHFPFFLSCHGVVSEPTFRNVGNINFLSVLLHFVHFLLLHVKAVFHTLLGSPYVVLWPFISSGC